MQRGLRLACAAAVGGALAVSGAAMADPFEENDSCAAAARIGNGLHTNLDVSLTDTDWYHLVAQFGQQVIVEIEHEWAFGDIDIWLYDECGGALERFSATESNFETIILTHTGFDDNYYLHVQFVDFLSDSNTYDLFVSGVHDPAPPACPCERDGTPGVDVFDLLAYLDLWFAADAAAELDGAGGVDVFDLLAFLDCWFPASAGSPCF